MARKRQLQTTFIAGELDAKLALRIDTKQYSNGAKSLLNRRCLIGGGTSRRPGTRDLTGLFGGGPRLIEFVFNENEQYVLSFTTPGIMIAYFPDGNSAGSVVGGPWEGGIVNEFDWMQQGNTIIITHFTFPPQIITRTSVNTWSLAPLAFFPNGPRLEQPYFKLAPPAMWLRPSTYGGIATVETASAWWRPEHVGQRIRYLGREMAILSVDSPTQVTASILEQLPYTFTIGVADKTVFSKGEVVLGSDSLAKGVIAGVSDTTPEVVVYARGASVITTGGVSPATFVSGGAGPGAVVPTTSLQSFTAGETLVGPAGTSKILGVAINPAPIEVTDWDEALFTPANGYPSCVALHRNRLCFGGHPKAPNLFMASRIGNLYSFNVGDGSDADAILVTIGDSAAAEIRQMLSSDQLLLATDKGLYYVPEGPNQPFRPSSMAFVNFGSPWPISGRLKMRLFDDGVIATSGNTVIKAKGTGDSQKTWTAQEVSILSPHLLKDPYDMAVTTNWEGGPERYCVFSNSDGSICVMMLVEAQDIRNFVPWTTAGFFGSVAVIKKKLYVAALRGTNPNFHLELFDDTLTLDGVQDIATEPELAGIPFRFPGRTINIVTFSGYSLGPWPLTMDDVPLGPYHCGDFYPTVIQTLPAALEDPRGSSIGELMKINEALVFTHESCRFTGNGYEKQAYLVTEDANLPPPRRTGPQRLKFLGWRRDPTLTITQPDPLPLTVLAIKTEVAW